MNEKDPVEVFCRIRPLAFREINCLEIQSTEKLLFTPIDDPKIKNKSIQYAFKFDYIFDEDNNQEEVFNHVALPLVESLINGEDGLLFTYGVTSSGKTYTMFGEKNNPGIVPRSIYMLFEIIGNSHIPKCMIKSNKLNNFEIQSDENRIYFERINQIKMKHLKSKMKNNNNNTNKGFYDNIVYTTFVSFTEIYNNNIYDLLDENCEKKILQSKILREDPNKNIYVNNVIEVEVKTAEETLNLYCMGSKRKKMAQTSLNLKSSRSHSIFTIRLISGNCCNLQDFRVSQLCLVDLAGSERCSRTNSSGQRLKEACSINNSLMSLRNCLEIMRENQKTETNKLIPYRDSRLTHLFKNYFEGQGKVKMIVCINPSLTYYEENVHVMKFAEMTQEVKITRPEIIQIAETPDEDLDMSLEPEFYYHRTKIPRQRATKPDLETLLPIIIYLKRRLQTFKNFSNLSKEVKMFRQRLLNLEKENYEHETQQKHVRPLQQHHIQVLKGQIKDFRNKYEQMIEENKTKNINISDLKIEIEEKTFKLKQELLDREMLKQKLDEISHTIEIKPPSSTTIKVTSLIKQPELLQNSLNIEFADEDTDQQIGSSAFGTLEQFNENIVCETSPQKGIAVSNRRYNRTQLKTGVWLEHKPAMPVPLGTVLQPKIRHRKSIRKLINKNDIVNSRLNKYVLISQNKDNQGRLETKLYKGDIIPTCSGGAQVILNDIEKLKQKEM